MSVNVLIPRFECVTCFEPLIIPGICPVCKFDSVMSVLPPNDLTMHLGFEGWEPDYFNCHWLDKVAEFSFRCAYCANVLAERHEQDEHLLTKDHVIPRSRGGVNKLCNIVPADKRCNSMKKGLTAAEFMEKRRGLCKSAVQRKEFQQVLVLLVARLSHRKNLLSQAVQNFIPFPIDLSDRERVIRRRVLEIQADQLNAWTMKRGLVMDHPFPEKKGVQHVLSTSKSTRVG